MIRPMRLAGLIAAPQMLFWAARSLRPKGVKPIRIDLNGYTIVCPEITLGELRAGRPARASN
jgi:hypothetical protein